MIFYSSLVTIYGLFAVAAAAPALRATPITTDCTNIALRSNWLVADCLTGQGSERIQSSVYLPTKITNREGGLEWKPQGAYAQSCIDCKLIRNTTLNCQCQPTFGKKIEANLDLSERIKNYNGHLLSDVAGQPSIPSYTSSLKFPSDLSWKLSDGKRSCWSDTPENIVKYCPLFPIQPIDECLASWSMVSDDGAPRCFSYRIPTAAPVWYQIQKLKTDAPSKAFRFEVYENIQCTGQPAGSVEVEEIGVCKDFERSVVGIKIVPLWNADVS